MYYFRKAVLTEGKSCKYKLYQQEERLRYADFITLIQEDEQFRVSLIEVLSDVSFPAYQWETPPVTTDTVNRLFEFVIINRPAIDLPPNPGPFRRYFADTDTNGGIAVFNNLGNDAKLIAPAPNGELNYSHLGVFCRQAPVEQQHELWKAVGRVTERQLSDQPLWLNTAGGGVAWLHVRLDSRPKYYRHRLFA